MHKRLLASRIIAGTGVLLLIVAGIHLTVTTLLKNAILDRVLTTDMLPVVAPPFLPNHVVVGILLIPLGFITMYCASGIRKGKRWAWIITFSIGLALLSLPVALVLIMRGGIFNAPAFLVAELLVTLSAVVMPATLLWVRSEFSHNRK